MRVHDYYYYHPVCSEREIKPEALDEEQANGWAEMWTQGFDFRAHPLNNCYRLQQKRKHNAHLMHVPRFQIMDENHPSFSGCHHLTSPSPIPNPLHLPHAHARQRDSGKPAYGLFRTQSCPPESSLTHLDGWVKHTHNNMFADNRGKSLAEWLNLYPDSSGWRGCTWKLTSCWVSLRAPCSLWPCSSHTWH